MLRVSVLVSLVVLLAPLLGFAQTTRPRLIDQAAAARHGLKRAWYGFVSVGGGRSPIVDIKFDGGTLFVQTGIATTHAIDGQTGRTLWVAQVGSPSHPSQPLGLSDSRVAAFNGTTLYVLNRETGQVEFSKSIRGVPAVGADLTDEAVFVPTIAGQVETYSLIEEDHRNVANLRLEGRELTRPAVSHIGVAVGSGRGDLGLLNLDGTSAIFRYPTNYAFAASPAAWGARFYAGNDGGLLYAFDDVSGREKWSYSAGSPITQTPVPFADAVYVLCEDLTMYRISAETGREEWRAKNVRTFLAQSPTKVYTIDRFGRLAVLSAKSGALIDRVSIPPFAFPVTNNDSDQVFLATDTGLIQSLHEIELNERMDYRPPKKEEPKAETSPKPGTTSAPATTETPAPAEPQPADEQPAPLPTVPGEDPFGPIPMPSDSPFGAGR
jgi:hypothetical protein